MHRTFSTSSLREMWQYFASRIVKCLTVCVNSQQQNSFG